MLKKSRIPTPLTQFTGDTAITIAPPKKAGRFETTRLVFRLVQFGLLMMWGRLRGRTDPKTQAVMTRQFLEGLGGLWIKAGQLISLRSDILSPEMAGELSKLTYRTTGFDPAIARDVVEESLGRPIEEVFDSWEAHPFAAASISQVHRGRLRENGLWVAVKVQRPGIAELFARDLRLISWLLRRFRRVPSLKFMDWEGMIRELQRIMDEEIDYRYEASNLRRMRKVLRPHKVYVPKLFGRFSGKHILVMEYVTGVLMADYLAVKRTDPARLEAWCDENNVKPKRVGSRLLRSFYRQLFEDNLFHGDFHPGNIILLRDSRFCLIDMGTIGNMESRFVRNYRMVLQGFAEKDYAKAVDYYLLTCDVIPVLDIGRFRQEMIEVLRAWEARSHLDGLSYVDRSITGGLASELSTTARSFNVNPSWQFLRVGRSFASIEANVGPLLGNTKPSKVVKKYFAEYSRRIVGQALRQAPGRIFSTVSELAVSSRDISELVRRQAIVFEGAQTRASYIMGVIFNVARWLMVGLGLFLLYDFLHLHHNELVAWFHDPNSFIGRIIHRIEPYPYTVGIVMLLLVVLAVIGLSRVRRKVSRPTMRLPNGRLDT